MQLKFPFYKYGFNNMKNIDNIMYGTKTPCQVIKMKNLIENLKQHEIWIID